MALSEQRRMQLDGIVQDMLKNKESENSIQFVVDDFKKKYESENLKPLETQSEKKSLGKKILDFGVGVAKSFGETGLRTAVEQNPVLKTAKLLIPEKVNLPIVGETSLRYSDKPTEKIGQMAEDALNSLPGATKLPAATLTAEQLATQGSKGFAGKLMKSAFKITENDLKKNPTLIKDFLVERVQGTRKGISTKAQTALDIAEEELGSIISNAKGKFIQTSDVLKTVEPLKKLYSNSALATEGVESIKKTVQDFVKRFPKKMSVQDAQEFKTNTYALLRKNYGKLSDAKIETAKQITRGIKEAIEEVVPEIKNSGVNKKIMIYSKARDLMERQINKAGRNELVGLKDIALTGATGSVFPTLARLVVESVPFKTYVANILTNKGLNKAVQSTGNLIKKATPAVKEIFTNTNQ